MPDRRLLIGSPNERLQLAVQLDDQGAPTFLARLDRETIIRESRLGFRFVERDAFDTGLRMEEIDRGEIDTQWEMPFGERRLVTDRHRELAVRLSDEAGRALVLRLRVFDDGFGFRYEFGEGDGFDGPIGISDELTEFRLPTGDTTLWSIPVHQFQRYEYEYRRTGVNDVEAMQTPATLRLSNGTHLAIHEAALVDYSAMSLQRTGDGIFKALLADRADGAKVRVDVPFVTPWRAVLVAPDAGGLVDSCLILNLNEPNRLGDVSWIRPGKYSGIWWSLNTARQTWEEGPKHGASTDNITALMDWSARNGIGNVLAEGWNIGWDGELDSDGNAVSFVESYDDFDLAAIVGHGESIGVGLMGHHETFGAVEHYRSQMHDAFALYGENRVPLVKMGYFSDYEDFQIADRSGIVRHEPHDGQMAVNHHLDTLRLAASHEIALIIHEPVKQTGLRRTYPNWLSAEGMRGQEYNAFGVPPNSPSHTVTLPFTRGLGGPMDYNPGIFHLTPNVGLEEDDLAKEPHDPRARVQTTLAKQLAHYVTLYSPMQMVPDLPENYARHPEAFRFIRLVPTDWETSRTVMGQIGDYIVVARQRRGGEDWYLGAASDGDARTLSVPLDFLPEGRFEAEIWSDGSRARWRENPYPLDVAKRHVEAGDRLELQLAPGGGAAVRLVPETWSGTDEGAA